MGRREAAEHCPQQAEAPGSAKAKGVTWLRGSDPPTPFPNSHVPRGKESISRRGSRAGKGGRSAAHMVWPQPAPPRGHAPKGAFTAGILGLAGAWSSCKDTGRLCLHWFQTSSGYFNGMKQVSRNSTHHSSPGCLCEMSGRNDLVKAHQSGTLTLSSVVCSRPVALPAFSK